MILSAANPISVRALKVCCDWVIFCTPRKNGIFCGCICQVKMRQCQKLCDIFCYIKFVNLSAVCFILRSIMYNQFQSLYYCSLLLIFWFFVSCPVHCMWLKADKIICIWMGLRQTWKKWILNISWCDFVDFFLVLLCSYLFVVGSSIPAGKNSWNRYCCIICPLQSYSNRYTMSKLP